MATQVRFHGSPQDVPAAFREAPPISVEEAKLNVTKLEAEKACLDKQLAPLLDKVQAGSSTPEEMTLVTDLAEDSRILADRLQHANVELRVIEEKKARQQSATARARFNFLVAEDRQKRALRSASCARMWMKQRSWRIRLWLAVSLACCPQIAM